MSDISVPLVFIQGILSFFSPCVLPLVPLYVTYLMGGTRQVGENGELTYSRATIFVNTVGFILGISFAFGMLGLGFSAVGQVLSDMRGVISIVSGILMIAFGLYVLGVFGKHKGLEREHRLPFKLDRVAMSPFTAFLLGFTFSFAWTPCVGPILTSVLLMASSSASMIAGFALVGLYSLGFCLPFLLVGLFTGQVLMLLKKYGGVVKVATKVAAVLLILMGLLTTTGLMNSASSFLAKAGSGFNLVAPASQDDVSTTAGGTTSENTHKSDTTAANRDVLKAPNFKLEDLNDVVHDLEQYKGKVVVLDFFTTWCTYCKETIPDLQELYENVGANQGDVVILGMANPRTTSANNNVDVSEPELREFLAGFGVEYPVLLDTTGDTFRDYQISGFPTTVIIGRDGSLVTYIPGAISKERLETMINTARQLP